MIVDRVISVRELEAPPPPPTKEQIEAWKKECEEAPNCFTHGEMKALRNKN
jgi:hypothetical protein